MEMLRNEFALVHEGSGELFEIDGFVMIVGHDVNKYGQIKEKPARIRQDSAGRQPYSPKADRLPRKNNI